MGLNDRIAKVRELRLCFSCLKPGHGSHKCPTKQICKVSGCERYHAAFLHGASLDIISQPQCSGIAQASTLDTSSEFPAGQSRGPVAAQRPFTGHVRSSHFVQGRKVALLIVAVRIMVPESDKFDTYALLDNGSTQSFCTDILLDKLGLEGRRGGIAVSTLGGQSCDSECRIVDLTVTSMDGQGKLELRSVCSKDRLPMMMDSAATTADANLWPLLRGLSIPRASTDHVTLLIGQDNSEAFFPLTTIHGWRNEPYAVKTLMGWILNGVLKDTDEDILVHAYFVGAMDTIHQDMERLWQLEIGDAHSEVKAMSVDDKRVASLWDESVRKVQGPYELPIPFRDSEPRLPASQDMAARRLASLGRRLSWDSSMMAQYSQGMDNLCTSGYAVRVPGCELGRDDGRVWYLPHQPVVNPNKDKVRIVFHSAAKYDGMTINDKVLPGPDLTNSLVGVLSRFRLRKVVLMADVEAMFHQVSVKRGTGMCYDSCGGLMAISLARRLSTD